MAGSKYKLCKGFTLVELVVVIIVIGLFLALLMPCARNAGREAGRRSVCNNSMRQLSHGTLQFESTKMRFPGYLEQPIPEHEREVPWLVSLMPYLERDDINDSWMNPTGKPAKSYLKDLRCLSDPLLANAKEDCNSYVGNAGLIVKTMTDSNSTYEDDNITANGIFVDLRRYREAPAFVRSKDIYDGQSNTLLISENLLAGGWGNVNPVVAPGKPESKVKLTTAFCWFDTATPTADMRINGNRATAKKLTPELLRPSSNHPAGVNTAFADGHTQFLRDNIDYRVYKQLMTSNNKKSSNSEKDYVLKDEDYE